MNNTDAARGREHAEAIEKGIGELCETLSRADDPQLIREFFSCLFTKAELHDVGARWLLVQELEKGTPQREIAKKLGISLCKITRGSRELKKENSPFIRMLSIFRRPK